MSIEAHSQQSNTALCKRVSSWLSDGFGREELAAIETDVLLGMKYFAGASMSTMSHAVYVVGCTPNLSTAPSAVATRAHTVVTTCSDGDFKHAGKPSVFYDKVCSSFLPSDSQAQSRDLLASA